MDNSQVFKEKYINLLVGNSQRQVIENILYLVTHTKFLR